ncbi:hypothetical protein E2320_005016 [Naja naja]|nr:hypothetical protein E2320_005016 [Naja naja]
MVKSYSCKDSRLVTRVSHELSNELSTTYTLCASECPSHILQMSGPTLPRLQLSFIQSPCQQHFTTRSFSHAHTVQRPPSTLSQTVDPSHTTSLPHLKENALYKNQIANTNPGLCTGWCTFQQHQTPTQEPALSRNHSKQNKMAEMATETVWPGTSSGSRFGLASLPPTQAPATAEDSHHKYVKLLIPPWEKKKWQHKEPGISPSDKGVAGWMLFCMRCPEGLQKPVLGAPNRYVTGGRGRILGWDCKQDTQELAGFKRGTKAAAAAEGGFSSPFVGPTSSLPALPLVPIGSSALLNGALDGALLWPPRLVTGAGKHSILGPPLEQCWHFRDKPPPPPPC